MSVSEALFCQRVCVCVSEIERACVSASKKEGENECV